MAMAQTGHLAQAGLDHLSTNLEIKSVNISQRIITGFAAGHGNLDRVTDIIDPSASVKAVSRLQSFNDVGVFIGHQSDTLPVGIPLSIKALPEGLLTETYIFKGPVGDNLLEVAVDLAAHGGCLGMSIGYQTKAAKPDRLQGKLVRRIMDYDLKEYSFAASQVIANPKALVSGVKSGSRRRKALAAASSVSGGYLVPEDAIVDDEQKDTDVYTVEQRGTRFHVLGGDGMSLIDFATEVEARAAVAALKADYDDEDEDEEDDDMDGSIGMGKTGADATLGVVEYKALWSQKEQNDLPDSSFLFIETGGVKDGEGKTVPRNLRHFPYKDASGAINIAHVRDAIGRIPQSNAEGLDAQEKTQLQNRCRKMLADAKTTTKTLVEDGEWTSGAPLAVLGLAYRLLDSANTMAAECKAMALLGEETKNNLRIRPAMREALATIHKELREIIEWSTMIDNKEDGVARLALLRQRLALTEV